MVLLVSMLFLYLIVSDPPLVENQKATTGLSLHSQLPFQPAQSCLLISQQLWIFAFLEKSIGIVFAVIFSILHSLLSESSN